MKRRRKHAPAPAPSDQLADLRGREANLAHDLDEVRAEASTPETEHRTRVLDAALADIARQIESLEK